MQKERRGKTASETSIIISEVERRKEKVLIVEKGPTTRTDARRDSIEVVSRSQFDLLENLVKDLQRRAGPPPAPSLPDNKKLRGDLARGSASLTDTMQAMQVTARVRAAEQAISRMGDLLTQLAAAGALPKDFTEQIDAVKFEAVEADVTTVSSLATKSRVDTTSRKSVAIQEGSTMKTGENERTRLTSTAISRMSAASSIQPQRMMSRASTASVAGMPGVTHTEMEAALQTMKDELMKNIQGLTSKASSVAENASVIAKNISEKLNIAIALDDRINTLNTLVSDYAEQLCGFDTGITTQLLSFKDQMSQINSDMRSGLAQLDQVNNNAETAAVMELTERYEGLALELDHTLHAHNGLTTLQRQLSNELHSLVECVEMLREQKADRDEVLDGLRDKADNARLAGLLTVIEFSVARSGLEKRLELCYDKFQRQDNVWMTALKDLMNLTEKKAEMTQLLSARENVEQALRDLQDRLEKLATILGEPKAAMLTRALARDATCGACQVPALMEPKDAVFGAPPPLPALRPQPLGANLEPCLAEWKPPPLPDNREHICHRWCGGSHTLLAPVTHEQAPPIESTRVPTKRYTGYGSDGRLYMMEEDLQPCAECNQFPEKSPEDISPELGAGDQGEKITIE